MPITRTGGTISVSNMEESTRNLKMFMRKWISCRKSFTPLLSMALLWTPTSPSLGTVHICVSAKVASSNLETAVKVTAEGVQGRTTRIQRVSPCMRIIQSHTKDMIGQLKDGMVRP